MTPEVRLQRLVREIVTESLVLYVASESPVGWRLSLLVKFLALEADPVTVMILVRAESCWHHRHAAVRTDRWTVIVIRTHVVSIPAAEAELPPVQALRNREPASMAA